MRYKESRMKTSTIPSLLVTPELRAAAESVLEEGETLSTFVEHSIRIQIERRRTQNEFIARGLQARDAAELTGEYFSAEDALKDLDELIKDAESKVRK